jgi:hypothetical protein
LGGDKMSPRPPPHAMCHRAEVRVEGKEFALEFEGTWHV